MWHLDQYRYAESPAEAVSLLRRGPGRGRFIAGGTDLLVAPPTDCDFVVDINGAGLDRIARPPDGSLLIGATATLQAVATSPLVAAYADGAVATAASRCGNRPVRTVATIGGNLCEAVPSADMAPILVALEARTGFTDEVARQEVPLLDFFIGPRRTILGDRLLVDVVLPASRAGWSAASRKLTRTAEDIALMQVAVAIAWEGLTIQAARVVLGAVGPRPLRAREAERLLEGLQVGSSGARAGIEAAAAAAAAAARPIDDHRAGAAYRRAMVEVLTARLVGDLGRRRQGELS